MEGRNERQVASPGQGRPRTGEFAGTPLQAYSGFKGAFRFREALQHRLVRVAQGSAVGLPLILMRP